MATASSASKMTACRADISRGIRKVVFVLLGLLLFISSAYPAGAQSQTRQPISVIRQKITHIKAYALNPGINNVKFWGVQVLPDGVIPQRLTRTLVARPSVVVIGNLGLGDRYSLGFFALSGGLSPTFLVRHPFLGERLGPFDPYMFGMIAAMGQGASSSVRFFNGIWKGHCQTFVATAETDFNENTEIATTSIVLYYFLPGQVFSDNSVGDPPFFVFLGNFTTTNKVDDPEIVLSQAFSIPLPHWDSEYGNEEALKEYDIPIETKSNVYHPGDASDSCP